MTSLLIIGAFNLKFQKDLQSFICIFLMCSSLRGKGGRGGGEVSISWYTMRTGSSYSLSRIRFKYKSCFSSISKLMGRHQAQGRGTPLDTFNIPSSNLIVMISGFSGP